MHCLTFQPTVSGKLYSFSTTASQINRRTQIKVINSKSSEHDEKMNETFFISHGRSKIALEESQSHPVRKFFKDWSKDVCCKKPKSILVVSAHWETDQPAVTAAVHSDILYDFHNFSDVLYQFKYPAPMSPDIARRIQELLFASGFDCVHMDKDRGLDHSAWVPLMFMYPEADIPVCELSVQPHLNAQHHFELGRALAPLKDEGVLIIGSGSATHPSDDTPHSYDGVAAWATEFDEWLEKSLTSGRYEEVNKCETKAPNWEVAHPWPEHFYPLQVALGAAGENCKAELIHNSWDHGTMSFGSYKFTST
uniref:stizolobate synthase n=1 Tax=Polycarpon tetraphyllum TaxID=115622 RepID=A0A5B8X9U8_9CARY|nr:DODA [Polycarpon tetraphyllum]QED21497.1 DODA [Polycarpon tetraphyllum]